MIPITVDDHHNFQQAYKYFNQQLFKDKLPSAYITLQRKKNSLGYYAPHKFKSRVNQAWIDEISINPGYFLHQTDEKILSRLVYLMVFQYQKHFGHPPARPGYLNREGADLLIERGLIPFRPGQPEGRQTGQKMSYYIKEGGWFQEVYQQLFAIGFRLNWQAVEVWPEPKPKVAVAQVEVTQPKQDKYTCPACGLNAWALPNSRLICGRCHKDKHIIREMKVYWDDGFTNWSNEELGTLTLLPGF